jgi:hypothetical protein
MVNNTAVRYFEEQKQNASCDENVLHFSLKVICLVGVFPYDKICNTPSKVKLFRAYQITLCPKPFNAFFHNL